MIESPQLDQSLARSRVPASDSTRTTIGEITGNFRSRRTTPTFAGMDREYWQKALNEAERELEAATTRSGLYAAARKVMRAKQELKWLGESAGRAGRKQSTHATASAGASS